LPYGEYQRFDQILRKAVQKSHDRAKFDSECRAAMKGKSRDEAREILIEQYRRIGEQPLGQPLLDRKLDMLITPTSPTSRVNDLVDGIGSLVGAGFRLKKLFQGPTDEDLRFRHKADLHAMPDWHRMSRVNLVEDAQSWLGEIEVSGLVAFRDMSAIAVIIEATAPRTDGGILRVLVGERQAGVIPDSESDVYWEVVQRDHTDLPATMATLALRTRADDGLWRLDLGAPDRVRPRLRFEDFPQDEPDE
jgi:hypothetical protein